MRTGAARGHAGHFHEAGFYGSDAEFAALIVPFAEEGIAAGEPVIIGYDDRKSGLLRSWLTDPSAVEFIGDNSLYATPARAIATYRRLFEFHVAMGAGQIRIAGDVPHPGNGGRFEGWDRYESAVNTVWQDFPVWGRCLYDTTTAPQAVLDIVERTHPRIVSPSGERRASDRYQRASVFDGLPYAPDPLEDSTPTIELVNRSAADARHALAQIGPGRIPRHHARRPADRRLRSRQQRPAPRPPARDRPHLGPTGPHHGHRPRHRPRPSRPPGRPSPRPGQHLRPATWTGAVGHAPARHRRHAQARRRRLHRQAPQRNNTRLSHAAGKPERITG
jgi:hypothetical protein